MPDFNSGGSPFSSCVLPTSNLAPFLMFSAILHCVVEPRPDSNRCLAAPLWKWDGTRSHCFHSMPCCLTTRLRGCYFFYFLGGFLPPVFFVPQAMAMPPLFSCCPLYLVFRAEPVAYKAFVDLLLLVTLFVFQRLRPFNRAVAIKNIVDHFLFLLFARILLSTSGISAMFSQKMLTKYFLSAGLTRRLFLPRNVILLHTL